jgi:hypothetical protein
VDEVAVGLCMTLPLDYPLTGIAVSSTDRLGVSEAQWRKWLLAVTGLLVALDGSC